MITRKQINSEAVQFYGIENQVRQLAEEQAELYIELNKMLRSREDASITAICEEIADVRIVLDQITEFLGLEEFAETMMQTKYLRLANRLGFEEEVIK